MRAHQYMHEKPCWKIRFLFYTKRRSWLFLWGGTRYSEICRWRSHSASMFMSHGETLFPCISNSFQRSATALSVLAQPPKPPFNKVMMNVGQSPVSSQLFPILSCASLCRRTPEKPFFKRQGSCPKVISSCKSSIHYFQKPGALSPP